MHALTCYLTRENVIDKIFPIGSFYLGTLAKAILIKIYKPRSKFLQGHSSNLLDNSYVICLSLKMIGIRFRYEIVTVQPG